MDDTELIDDHPDRLLRPREVCDRIGCHLGSLRRWRRTGEIRPESYVVLGTGCYRYRWLRVVEDLEARAEGS